MALHALGRMFFLFFSMGPSQPLAHPREPRLGRDKAVCTHVVLIRRALPRRVSQ